MKPITFFSQPPEETRPLADHEKDFYSIILENYKERVIQFPTVRWLKQYMLQIKHIVDTQSIPTTITQF